MVKISEIMLLLHPHDLIAKCTAERVTTITQHGLDAAAVAIALWDTYLPDSTKNIIARELGQSPDKARLTLVYIVSLHDIGKASVDFHSKLRNIWPHLITIDPDLVHHYISEDDHSLTSAAYILIAHKNIELAGMVAAHHSTPPSPDNIKAKADNLDLYWVCIMSQIDCVLRKVIGPTLPIVPVFRISSVLIAGIISVSDWIASNAIWFPLSHDIASYKAGVTRNINHAYGYTQSLRKARIAVRAEGFVRTRYEHGFQEIFGFSPNRLQLEIEDICQTSLNIVSPYCIAIESGTGTGKTEAGLLTYFRTRTINHNGLVIALPTRIMCNSTYIRYKEFLTSLVRIFPETKPSLILSHGTAGAVRELDNDELISCPKWFRGSGKRGLLSQFSVCTIDQLLLAITRGSPHGHTRLLGLCGKTIIIDEVHVYQSFYMGTLLCRLMEWLGAMGTSVILLSATLSDNVRNSMMSAWAKGARIDTTIPPGHFYPRVTILSRDISECRQVEVTSKRVVSINIVPGLPIDTITSRMANRECILVVCSTVKQAQNYYVKLCLMFGRERVGLLHSGYKRFQRQYKEDRILHSFGKDKAHRPKDGYILVSTQIVESSLDISFDALITDIAPLDYILQRIGRLDRWGLSKVPPVCYVMINDSMMPSAYVYDAYLLARSAAVLWGRTQIVLPDDTRGLIQLVYDAVPEPESSEMDLYQDMVAEMGTQRDKAMANSINLSIPPYIDMVPVKTNGQAERGTTRLINLNATAAMLYRDGTDTHFNPGSNGSQSRLDLTIKPNDALTRRIIEHSVPITDSGVAGEVLKTDTPAGWKATRELKYLKPLISGDEFIVGNKIKKVTYSQSLGIVITSRRIRL